MTALELFCGAGGLTLGVSRAGFEHLAIIERAATACETIRQNQERKHPLAAVWPLHECDVRDFEYKRVAADVDLLTAGLPCQPFSVAGKSHGNKDKRDMFSEVVRAARELQPKAILIENVPGLMRTTFQDYLNYLRLALAFPTLTPTSYTDPSRGGRLKRVDQLSESRKYSVHIHMVNAADYGVPQWRKRVLIVAFRSDLDVQWSLPPASHSLDALLWDQLKTGTYWKRHQLNRVRLGKTSRRIRGRRRLIQKAGQPFSDAKPWQTVRDALRGLPRLRQGQRDPQVLNHFINRGARRYPGHQGSLIDEPAKVLKAGSHGVPGGENSLYLGRNRIRYFSVRECARIQTIPDDYLIAGSWTQAMRQIGNAVPVRLAEVIAASIRMALSHTRTIEVVDEEQQQSAGCPEVTTLDSRVA